MLCGEILERILDHLMVFPLCNGFVGVTTKHVAAISVHIGWSICPPIGLYTAISLQITLVIPIVAFWYFFRHELSPPSPSR